MTNMAIQLWRSPRSSFGEVPHDLDDGRDETMCAVDAYTDEELEAIAAEGFNGIWIHGILRNMVQSTVFPEFGALADSHQDAVRRLIERAARFGIKVYIYMQPPRGIPAASHFWQQHADVAGADEVWDDSVMRCLCTSTGKVRRYLRESSEALVRSLEGLGGLILITASEYPSHCWARSGYVLDAAGRAGPYRRSACPRCAGRSPVEIVNEVIEIVHAGAKAADPRVEVIAWNWSWNAYEPDPSERIVNNLPTGVIVMADFERGGRKLILGRERVIDEYSLVYPGPSVRFTSATDCARAAGLRVMAKLQIGATHELATVPNLPLVANLYEKARFLKSGRFAGFMGCWNFGNMRTVNTAAFHSFLSTDAPGDKRTALEIFAESYFPGCRPERVADAWEAFSAAADHYPFCVPMLYGGPINYAVAYPLRPGPITDERPCGPSWYHLENRGESLEESLGDFSLGEVIEAFAMMTAGWERGLEALEEGLAATATTSHAGQELNTATVCLHVLRSTRNLYRCWQLRCQWDDTSMEAYQAIASDELEHLRDLLPILKQDWRQGFHGEAFVHFFDAEAVTSKIREIERQIAG